MQCGANPSRGSAPRREHPRRRRAVSDRAGPLRLVTRPGDPFNPAVLAGDVREVHSLGFFRNVRVLTEESLDGWIVIFRVEENPVVRQVSISGNDSLPGDKIRDTLTLTTGSTLDRYDRGGRLRPKTRRRVGIRRGVVRRRGGFRSGRARGPDYGPKRVPVVPMWSPKLKALP